MAAIERVLLAPPNWLHRADPEAVMVWVTAPHGAGWVQRRRTRLAGNRSPAAVALDAPL
jgi:hypothetical protein